MLLIVLPLVASMLVNSLSGCDFSRSQSSFLQPPGYVFGVAWTLIYLCFGYSLYRYRTKATTMLWVLNLVVNLSWPVVYNCYERYDYALAMIVLLFALTAAQYTLTLDTYAKLALVPYMVWLMVAASLNVEVLRSTEKILQQPCSANGTIGGALPVSNIRTRCWSVHRSTMPSRHVRMRTFASIVSRIVPSHPPSPN